jgi:hypothetical protein
LLTLKNGIDENSYLGIAITDKSGAYIFGSNTRGVLIKGNKIEHSIILDLGPGSYILNSATFNTNGKILDLNEGIYSFKIISDENPNVGGLARLKYGYDTIE